MIETAIITGKEYIPETKTYRELNGKVSYDTITGVFTDVEGKSYTISRADYNDRKTYTVKMAKKRGLTLVFTREKV